MILHLKVPKYHCAAAADTTDTVTQASGTDSEPQRLIGSRSLKIMRTESASASSHSHISWVQPQLITGTSRLSASVSLNSRAVSVLRCWALMNTSLPAEVAYATTWVDLKNHKVFDVVLGRS